MLDGPKEARGLDYFDIGGIAVSPDHRLMAWAADLTGSESYVIRVRELGTGIDHDRLERTSGDIVWGRDGRFLYYIELDASQRPYRVMRHRLGEPQEADAEIYREADSGWFVGLDRTQDDRYAFIDIHDHETTEVLLLDLRTAGSPRIIAFWPCRSARRTPRRPSFWWMRCRAARSSR